MMDKHFKTRNKLDTTKQDKTGADAEPRTIATRKRVRDESAA